MQKNASAKNVERVEQIDGAKQEADAAAEKRKQYLLERDNLILDKAREAFTNAVEARECFKIERLLELNKNTKVLRKVPYHGYVFEQNLNEYLLNEIRFFNIRLPTKFLGIDLPYKTYNLLAYDGLKTVNYIYTGNENPDSGQSITIHQAKADNIDKVSMCVADIKIATAMVSSHLSDFIKQFDLNRLYSEGEYLTDKGFDPYKDSFAAMQTREVSAEKLLLSDSWTLEQSITYGPRPLAVDAAILGNDLQMVELLLRYIADFRRLARDSLSIEYKIKFNSPKLSSNEYMQKNASFCKFLQVNSLDLALILGRKEIAGLLLGSLSNPGNVLFDLVASTDDDGFILEFDENKKESIPKYKLKTALEVYDHAQFIVPQIKNLDAKYANGETLLHLLIKKGYKKMAKAIIHSGRVDLNVMDDNGLTALDFCKTDAEREDLCTYVEPVKEPSVFEKILSPISWLFAEEPESQQTAKVSASQSAVDDSKKASSASHNPAAKSVHSSITAPKSSAKIQPAVTHAVTNRDAAATSSASSFISTSSDAILNWFKTAPTAPNTPLLNLDQPDLEQPLLEAKKDQTKSKNSLFA